MKLVPHVLYLSLVLLSSNAIAAAPSSFAFGPNNSWVIVHEDQGSWGYRYRRLPADLAKSIQEMSENQVVLGVAINEGSWVLVGSKTMSWCNIPDDLRQYIQEQKNQGYQIIDVALTANNRWVVLSRKGSYHRWRSIGGDVPQGLVAFLRHATDNNYRVLGVGITPSGGWAASYRTSSRVVYRMRSVPSDSVEYSDEVDRNCTF